MAATHKLYASFYLSLLNKEIDLATDTIKAMLCTSSYTPDQSNHRYKNAVTNEVSGSGYTAGGVTIAGPGGTGGVSVTKSGLTVTVDGADTQWPSSTLTGRYLIIYDASPGSDATRPLISFVDFGADVSTTSGTFQAVWNSAGIFALTVA